MKRLEPGDELTADRVNELMRGVEAYRSSAGMTAAATDRPPLPPGCVLVRYEWLFSRLPRFSLVMLEAIPVPQAELPIGETPMFVARQSSGEGKILAITQEPIAAGGLGVAMLAGVTPARVFVNSRSDEYVTVGNLNVYSGLQTAPKGRFGRILWLADGAVRSTVEAVIQLSAVPPAPRYEGYFAVERVTIDGVTWIRVFDSAKPDSPIAGKTDLGDVPVTLLPNIVFSSGSVYLVGEWTGTAYSVFVTTTKPNSWRCGFYELASIDTKIVQRYLGGTQINFAERYFV